MTVAIASVRVKANANYICQECGSAEFIQAHHHIPKVDTSLVALCAECHSQKHPTVPRALFFTKSNQPYWHNKSAATLARQLGVHSRTIIRYARKLDIFPGKLSTKSEHLIKTSIPKLNHKPLPSKPVPRKRLILPTITTDDLLTVPRAAEEIGVHFTTLYRRQKAGKVLGITLGGVLFIPRSEVERIKQARQ